MSNKHNHPCAIAETLNILGDRWSLLIIREAFYGTKRFSEFLKNTGISRNLLTERLQHLVEEDILEKIPFSDRGTSFVYQLTEKGRALEGVILAIIDWGNRYLYGERGVPVTLVDEASGAEFAGVQPVLANGKPATADRLKLKLGPGGDGRTRNRIEQAKPRPFSK